MNSHSFTLACCVFHVHLICVRCLSNNLHHPSFIIGSSKPSLNTLLPAIPRLTHSWDKLGLALGAKNFTLLNIKASSRDDLEKCCREMLQNWIDGKQGCGDCLRTWNALLPVVQSVVGSEASDFIKSNILNWKEDGEPMETAGSKCKCYTLYLLHTLAPSLSI